MSDLSREQVLDAIQNGWGTYVGRFRRLSPEAQDAFLHQQGYARLADLLAHVSAWWREGQQAVTNLLSDPGFQSPEHDVDAFNASAVQGCRGLSEAAVIQAFESARKDWLDLVSRLPDAAFRNQRIVDRLRIELLGHLAEHEIAPR